MDTPETPSAAARVRLTDHAGNVLAVLPGRPGPGGALLFGPYVAPAAVTVARADYLCPGRPPFPARLDGVPAALLPGESLDLRLPASALTIA